MKRQLAWPVSVAAMALVISGCSGGDGGGSESSSSSSATSSSAAAPANPLTDQAAVAYKEYAGEQANELVRVVKVLTDAVRAGDLQAAQAAYAPSRQPWERIEPLAGLVEEIDGKVDARVDDFAGADDPKFTGWHRLEYLLFEKNTTEGGKQFADQLDADIASLQRELFAVEVTPVDVATGAAELIEEVSQGKITGEEDRYSKTDLWDFDANLQGSQEAIKELTPALQQSDPALLDRINKGFADLYGTLQPLRRGNGWVAYCVENDQFPSPRLCPAVTVPPQTVDTLKAQLASLSESVSKVSGVLGLQ